MAATRDDLRRWLEAGLIDTATAGRIEAYEEARPIPREAVPERPGVAELLIYLAAAIIGAGIAVLVATNWGHLSTPTRIAVPALASVAVFSVGSWLRRRPTAGLVRGASLLWLVAGALATATAFIGAAEAGLGENDVALTGGVVAVLASVALWWPMRMHPQIAGMAGAAMLFSTALGSQATEDWIVGVMGTSLAGIGVLALIAAEAQALIPRLSARLLAGAGLAAGGFFAGMPPSPPIMELVAAISVFCLLASGLRFQSLVYVAFGVLTAFAAMLTVILRYIDSPTFAGLALLALGLLLMIAITGLNKFQPWSRLERSAG